MPGYLGIDVGGTGSRWVVLGRGGDVLARGMAAGATGHLFNPESHARFVTTLAVIAGEAGRSFAAVQAGVTGLGGPAAAEARALLSQAFGTAVEAVEASDDIELAFRTRFAPGAGHLVSAGTGSVGLHIRADDGQVRVGGRGILIDDAGSGAWIALRALDAVYRRVDETGGPDDAKILADALFAAIGGSDWDSVRAYVYAGDRGRIGALAQAVASAARAGDEVAQRLIAAAGEELARLASALIARGGFAPVDFIGGVLDLHPGISEGIAGALPGVEIGFPKIDAALGAAQIAYYRHGAGS